MNTGGWDAGTMTDFRDWPPSTQGTSRSLAKRSAKQTGKCSWRPLLVDNQYQPWMEEREALEENAAELDDDEDEDMEDFDDEEEEEEEDSSDEED